MNASFDCGNLWTLPIPGYRSVLARRIAFGYFPGVYDLCRPGILSVPRGREFQPIPMRYRVLFGLPEAVRTGGAHQRFRGRLIGPRGLYLRDFISSLTRTWSEDTTHLYIKRQREE